jgi:hypothetical protein
LSDIGTNETEDPTERFGRSGYVSIRPVGPTEVTATVERDALDGHDPALLRPTGSLLRAAPIAAIEEEEELDDIELVEDDPMLIEMESIVAPVSTSVSVAWLPAERETEPVTKRAPSVPPPLPAAAKRASSPSIAAPPPSDPPSAPPLPLTLPAEPASVADVSIRPPVPAPPPSHVPIAAPAVYSTPVSVPPPFHETPSVSPVSLDRAESSERSRASRSPRVVRLSPALWVGLLALFGASLLAFGVVFAFHRPQAAAVAPPPEPARTEVAPASEPPQAPRTEPVVWAETLPPASPPAPPAVSVETLPKIVVDPEMTLVSAPPSAKGHRVFVDGRVIGTAGKPMQTKCGEHRVKVGSAGTAKAVQLPCGGVITLD